MNLTKRAIAECIGTFVLVFFACGTAILTGGDVVATALTFGLVIVAMAYAIGGVSGCHINPAVSTGLLLAKKINLKEFLAHVLAQMLGALLGAAVLYGLLKGTGRNLKAMEAWATNDFSQTGAAAYITAFVLEIIMTFVFVYTIIAVVNRKDSGHAAGIIIGLTLTLVHLLGIGFIGGTSVNPARSFGPAVMRAIFGGGTIALEQLWIFILAPLIGAVAAAFVYKMLNGESQDESKGEFKKMKT